MSTATSTPAGQPSWAAARRRDRAALESGDADDKVSELITGVRRYARSRLQA